MLASTGPQSLRDGKTEQSRLPKTATPAVLPSGNTGALAVRETDTGLVSSSGNIVPSQLSAEQKVTPALQEQPDSTAEMDMRDIELEEEWDGVILTEEELEHIAQTLKKKPSPVEQKGREFFDSEGNFLFRIWAMLPSHPCLSKHLLLNSRPVVLWILLCYDLQQIWHS